MDNGRRLLRWIGRGGNFYLSQTFYEELRDRLQKSGWFRMTPVMLWMVGADIRFSWFNLDQNSVTEADLMSQLCMIVDDNLPGWVLTPQRELISPPKFNGECDTISFHPNQLLNHLVFSEIDQMRNKMQGGRNEEMMGMQKRKWEFAIGFDGWGHDCTYPELL